MTSSLQAGINAAKAGRMQEALEHLKDAIIEEPQNADVWVWVAAIIDDTNKQAIFLEKRLRSIPTTFRPNADWHTLKNGGAMKPA